MKMPVNFSPLYYKMLKKESERIAQSFIAQLGLGKLPFSEVVWQPPKYISEKISADLVRLMDVADFEVLLNFFVCSEVHLKTNKYKPGLFVVVHSLNCANGILRTISKVRPVRVNK